jgi:hypothetical protein
MKRIACSVVLLLGVSGCSGSDDDDRVRDNPEDPSGPETDLPESDGEPGTIEACQYMDVVFSLDNSGSMQEEKGAMTNEVFPAFADVLDEVGNGNIAWRAAVIDACPTPPSFHTAGLGGSCDFSGDNSWMYDGSPRLADEFRCVSDIDPALSACSGENDDEQPASSIAAALEATDLNPGFLRENSLLVSIAITDEDEQPTPDQSAQGVHDRLVALKGGDIQRITFLGIGGATDCEGVYGEAREASKLKATTSLFANEERGLFVDLCEGRLEDGLSEIITIIDQACDQYCPDPDGCEPGTPPPPPGGECEDSADCPSGEFCYEGTCIPIIG